MMDSTGPLYVAVARCALSVLSSLTVETTLLGRMLSWARSKLPSGNWPLRNCSNSEGLSVGGCVCACVCVWDCVAVLVWTDWLVLLSAVTIVSLGLRLRGPGPEPKLSGTPGATIRVDWLELTPDRPEDWAT